MSASEAPTRKQFRFEFMGISARSSMSTHCPKEDFDANMQEWCKEWNLDFIIVHEDTVVTKDGVPIPRIQFVIITSLGYVCSSNYAIFHPSGEATLHHQGARGTAQLDMAVKQGLLFEEYFFRGVSHFRAEMGRLFPVSYHKDYYYQRKQRDPPNPNMRQEQGNLYLEFEIYDSKQRCALFAGTLHAKVTGSPKIIQDDTVIPSKLGNGHTVHTEMQKFMSDFHSMFED